MPKSDNNYGICRGRVEHIYKTENKSAIILTLSTRRESDRGYNRYSYPKFTFLGEMRDEIDKMGLEKHAYVEVAYRLSTSKREHRVPVKDPSAPKGAFLTTFTYYQDCIATGIKPWEPKEAEK